jgi:carbonic anhydrase/acetyltransferase-like protein (isoleucine patch superfamily)
MRLETGQNGSIITYNEITPLIHPSVFICEGVKIIGDVEIGEDSSIWYNSVIRGDVNYIRIGSQTNIQDLCLLHVTHDTHPLIIGNKVSVGHAVKLHGTTIYDNCLIGTGAILLDGSVINSYSLVAAGSVVLENFKIPEGTLAAGIPAKILRDLTTSELERINETSENYLKYVVQYRSQL